MPIIAKEIPVFNQERFLSKIKVNQDNGCWEWQMRLSTGGYGVFHINGWPYQAHRCSLSLFKSLSRDLVVDHMCRNRSCVNPDHLREVTLHINNIENSTSIQASNSIKTHCDNGHEFTPQNTYSRYRRIGGRICRECVLSRSRLRVVTPEQKLKRKLRDQKNREKLNRRNREWRASKVAKICL